jgi:hypothetical protein
MAMMYRWIILAGFTVCLGVLRAQTGKIVVQEWVKTDRNKKERVTSMGVTLYQDGKTIPCDPYNAMQNDLTFSGLSPGVCTLVYPTLFWREAQKLVVHDGKSVVSVDLFQDTFQHDAAVSTLTQRLLPGDTMTIKMYGYGCEPFDGGTFTLTGQAKAGFVSFQQDQPPLHIKVKKRLKPTHIQQIDQLERQLRQLSTRGGGGTNTLCAEIWLNGTRQWSMCQLPWEWWGMGRLRRSIFGK